MRAPSDQHIRTQIIEDQCNQMIIAGAGSGKTTLVVEKYLHLIKQGLSPDKIIAITFTNKAADELKARIAQTYQTRYPDAPSLAVWQLPITTIHGFCNQLLQSYSFKFGYLPSYEVEQEYMFERRAHYYQETLPTLYRQYPKLNLWKHLGWLSFSKIYSWLLDMQSKHFAAINEEDDLGAEHVDEVLKAFRPVTAQLPKCHEISDRFLCKVVDLRAQLKKIDMQNPSTWTELLTISLSNPIKIGAQKNWQDGQDLVQARALMDKFSERLNAFKHAFSQSLIKDLLFLHETLEASYLAFKQSEQLMEPDDLLKHTQKLLQDPILWQQISSQIDYVFVDEFQDTNPIQTDIIMRLISKDFPDKQSWQDITPSNALTVVGDPQQSIYRFRQASIEIFDQACEHLQNYGGKVYRITENFRSDATIIDFTNETFATMDYFSPLNAYTDKQDFPVAIVAPPTPSQKTPDQEPEHLTLVQARVMEAKLIAKHLHIFLNDHPNYKPKDVALLLPTFSHIDILEDALAEHFKSVRLRRSQNLPAFFQSLMTVLTFMIDPEKPLHLQHLLRTPFFFHNLQSLSKVITQSQSHYLNLEAPSLKSALEKLTRACKRSVFFGMKLFADHVEPLVSDPDKDMLHWCLDQVLVYQSQNLALNELIQHLEHRFRLDYMPASQDEDTLALMTMHQSKGLEFPIVAIAGIYAQAFKVQMAYTDPKTQVTEKMFGPFSNWLHTDHIDAIKAQEKQALLEEKKRLLYVACTRAQKHLCIAKVPFQSRVKTYADILFEKNVI